MNTQREAGTVRLAFFNTESEKIPGGEKMAAKRSIIPVFVPHLGCPYLCVFCDQNRISGSLRPATADTVRAALDEGLAKLPDGTAACLAFYGGSFTAIPENEQRALLDAAAPYLADGRLESIRLSTRPDCIDGEKLALLRRSGVRTVELGVQSMCPEVLEASGRGHTAADVVSAAKMVKDAGFELILQMMTGLPGDTPERSIYTARRLIEMKPDGVRIYPTVVVKGTTLYDMWRSGTYAEHTVEDATRLGAVLLDMFDEAGIPVIRFGLNPTEDLSGGEAAAGAYHPALRELAEGQRYLKRERALLSENDRGADVVFGVAPGKISAAVGQHRCNAAALKDEFGLGSVRFAECEAEGMEVVRIK